MPGDPQYFPLTIPIWKVAPAPVADCTSVLKPSPFTPYSAALEVAHPFDPDADVCPVVNEDRMTACLAAVAKAQEAGAKVAVGGHRHTDGVPDGYYVQPTVLRDVPWDCEIAQEEIFGPVLSVVDCDGFDDAMRVSNSVKYGMSGTIFTQNPAHIFEAAEPGQGRVRRRGGAGFRRAPAGFGE